MSDAYERKLTLVYDALEAHNWKVSCMHTWHCAREIAAYLQLLGFVAYDVGIMDTT